MTTVLVAGLPNITGYLGMARTLSGSSFDVNPSGAFYSSYTSEQTIGSSAFSNNGRNYYFDASKSNNAYGKSSTVQPPAISLIPQIKF